MKNQGEVGSMKKVTVQSPADLMDIFLSPYYGWVIDDAAKFVEKF